MPITKQAIKRMRQNKTRHDRNRHYISRMKSMIKLILGYAKKNEADNALKVLPEVTSAIDTAAKKKLIHKNNADRKKSRIQKVVSGFSSKISAKISAKTSPEKESNA